MLSSMIEAGEKCTNHLAASFQSQSRERDVGYGDVCPIPALGNRLIELFEA